MSAPSYTFDSPDADIILRAPLHPEDPKSTEFVDFHTHKPILATASTAFRGMLSVPQPPRLDGDPNLPIVHISEPAEVFEIFLRLIYPIKPPKITSLQTVDHLSQLTIKYMVDCVHAKLEQILVSPSFLKSDPVWVYTIACRMDLEEEAKLAIPYTYQINLVQDIPPTLLEAMSAKMYNRLLRSHAARRENIRISVLDKYKGMASPYEGKCVCGPWFYTRLLKNIHLAIWEKPFLDRPRLNSCLSKVESIPKSECGPGTPCRISGQVVSAYFTRILDAIDMLE